MAGERKDPSKGANPLDPSNDRRCTARTRRGPCRNRPIRGGNVCKVHGGRAPQVRAKAAERLAMHDAMAELARRGIPPVDNPLSALAALAGEITATKNIFRERLGDLDEAAWRYSDAKGAEQLRAEVALYERALDRSARVLADIARLKIDERLAAVSEAQGRTLAAVITVVLERLDLGEKTAQVQELIATELDRLDR